MTDAPHVVGVVASYRRRLSCHVTPPSHARLVNHCHAREQPKSINGIIDRRRVIRFLYKGRRLNLYIRHAIIQTHTRGSAVQHTLQWPRALDCPSINHLFPHTCNDKKSRHSTARRIKARRCILGDGTVRASWKLLAGRTKFEELRELLVCDRVKSSLSEMVVCQRCRWSHNAARRRDSMSSHPL